MSRSIAALTIVLAALLTACGGGSSKTPTPTTVAVATEAQTAPPTAKTATAAPLADFCSRVPAADIEAFAGLGAAPLSSQEATRVASTHSGPAGACNYRSAVAWLTIDSITQDRYAAVRASEVSTGATLLNDVGDEGTLRVADNLAVTVDGTTYTGFASLAAKKAGVAVTLSVLATGESSGQPHRTIDTERLKALARLLLQ
jgi:hypothetical protein